MLEHSIYQLLFIDIETVSSVATYEEMDLTWKNLWQHKIERQLTDGETPATFYDKRAAIMAEFGKIICVSLGYFKQENDLPVLRIKSFSGHQEKEVLENLMVSFTRLFKQQKGLAFCGHNIREFDIPYLCRRLLINGLAIPAFLDFQAMKPWETNLVDTLQLWKFGDFKNYTSLNLLAACLQIPSPKDDIDGSMVGTVYWHDNDLPRIVEYCQKDVVTVAQVILKCRQMPLIDDSQIVIVQ